MKLLFMRITLVLFVLVMFWSLVSMVYKYTELEKKITIQQQTIENLTQIYSKENISKLIDTKIAQILKKDENKTKAKSEESIYKDEIKLILLDDKIFLYDKRVTVDELDTNLSNIIDKNRIVIINVLNHTENEMVKSIEKLVKNKNFNDIKILRVE